MTANSNRKFPNYKTKTKRDLEELARRQGITRHRTLEEMACPEIFGTDEELAEFLVWLRKERNGDLA